MKIVTFLDLTTNEIRNVRLENLAADPSGGDLYEGRIWENSTSHTIKWYDGTTVKTLGDAGVLTLTVDNVTIENYGTATNPAIRVKALGITNAEIDEGAAIALSKLAQNPLARANHTGTQLAVTISDFDTAVRLSRLDQMAAPTADVSMNSHKLTNVTDPTAAQDAATKAYVDSVAAGLAPKDAVRAASTANGTLATAYENGDTLDGVVLATGDRILLKAQTAGAENGIYTVNASGAPTRATDADSSGDLVGAAVFVSEGTINGNTLWVMTTDAPIVVGTTALVWSQFGGPGAYTAGTGLTLSGTQFALTTPVAVANGGTNATTVAGAKTSLGFLTRQAFDSSIGTSTVCTHNLNTLDVQVSVWEVLSGLMVLADVVLTSVNVVTVNFSIAAGASQYRIVVIG